VKNNKNTSENTSSAFAAKRLAVGAASVVAACALVGVGAQGAFAAGSDSGPSGSATGSGSAAATATASPNGASVSAHAGFSLGAVTSDLGQGLFSGRIDGAKAQALAKRIVADPALFSLLPTSLQSDLTSLKSASVHDRTTDAKKIVTTALAGGYGTAIQQLATQLKSENGHAVKTLVGDVVRDLKRGALADGPTLGATGAKIAASISGDAQLAAQLPASLRSDLSSLATAPASEQTADVQKVLTTALNGGYGAQVKQVAGQVEQEILSAR
jgi:hypothetical protein